VPSAVTPDLHDVGNWMDGFFMAAICRTTELLDQLDRVPMKLLRGSATRGLEEKPVHSTRLSSVRSTSIASSGAVPRSWRVILGAISP
jgi:hypothetical protein